MKKTSRRLTRLRYPMPGYLRTALVSSELMAAYKARSPYLRNDYIAWIARAKQPATREKRIAQMLDELRRGGIYMKMIYRPKRTAQDRSSAGTSPARRDH